MPVTEGLKEITLDVLGQVMDERGMPVGRLRQNLRKYISQGELLGRQGKDVVSIPIPQVDLPRFKWGDKQGGGVGQGGAERVEDGLGLADGVVLAGMLPGRLQSAWP